MKRLFSLLTLAVLVASAYSISGCAPKNTAGGGTDSTKAMASDVDANKATARKIYDMFNARTLDSLGQVITTDAVDHDPDPGQGPGLAGLIAGMKKFESGFSDLKFTVVNMVAEGDLVATSLRVSGTNDGPMMGMPATHKKFDISAMDMMRFKNGKGTDRWGNYDGMAFMTQLGMMPPPPGGGAPPPADKKK